MKDSESALTCLSDLSKGASVLSQQQLDVLKGNLADNNERNFIVNQYMPNGGGYTEQQ